jgi:hypothetical protein
MLVLENESGVLRYSQYRFGIRSGIFDAWL